MPKTFTVVVVDDYQPWRPSIRRTLGKQSHLKIEGVASNGADAVKKVHELHPDLILLDIGMPVMNGVEAARQIRKASPETKILFLSAMHSPDVVETALGVPADGYVLKSDAGRELLSAIEAVLQGERFVSARLSDRGAAIDETADLEGEQLPGVE